uniref:Protein kinase C-binding protein NELL2 n=1 Tax=Clastoptera arizonana TaxID=38151 RepID=A0A1B6DC00_9HEMI
MNRVEECDCQKSCMVNGSIHADGASWQKDCDICSCVHGEVQCRPVQCPAISCKKPVQNPGECCKSCLKQCYLRGTLYDHGDSVNFKQCVECECRDGSMHCTRIDPETMCPPLPCPPSQQFSVPDECCKFCPDVNECLNKGGENGHHCHSNTRCVNTFGGYECECLPGHRRLDRYNCVEIDECTTGQHQCNIHATCRNTQGSYHCECQEGYSGDGYTCEPVCSQKCLNGGECVKPGECLCRRGYRGDSCEHDVDECKMNLHECQPSAVCVNMLGWYYCRCKPGYKSTMHPDNTLASTCQDFDECSNGSHTCHPTAKCVNTDGGFHCTCLHKSDNNEEFLDCKLSCMLEGEEIENGIEITPKGEPCKRCTCLNGVLSCVEPQCDCSEQSNKHNKCCPQCDSKADCKHQELTHVKFHSGERWIYQCQTCECLFGEVDCWPMECPPLSCSDPILTPGDCCARCHNDPCSLDTFNSSTSTGKPCAYAGRLYDSGSRWNDPFNRCTACNCKVPFCDTLDGRLCCTFDTSCNNDYKQPHASSLLQQPTSLTAPKSSEASFRPAISEASESRNNYISSTIPSTSESMQNTFSNTSTSDEDYVGVSGNYGTYNNASNTTIG